MEETIIKTIITVIVSSVITGVIVYAKTKGGQVKALKNGMLSLLRAEIIRQHEKWAEKGYCPIYAKDALDKAYSSYHSLGGNGTMTVLFNETMALSEELEKE